MTFGMDVQHPRQVNINSWEVKVRSAVLKIFHLR